MKHRIKRLVSMILVLMMGLGMNVMAEEIGCNDKN